MSRGDQREKPSKLERCLTALFYLGLPHSIEIWPDQVKKHQNFKSVIKLKHLQRVEIEGVITDINRETQNAIKIITTYLRKDELMDLDSQLVIDHAMESFLTIGNLLTKMESDLNNEKDFEKIDSAREYAAEAAAQLHSLTDFVSHEKKPGKGRRFL